MNDMQKCVTKIYMDVYSKIYDGIKDQFTKITGIEIWHKFFQAIWQYQIQILSSHIPTQFTMTMIYALDTHETDNHPLDTGQ